MGNRDVMRTERLNTVRIQIVQPTLNTFDRFPKIVMINVLSHSSRVFTVSSIVEILQVSIWHRLVREYGS